MEDEAHVLFWCVAESRLVKIREEFLAKLAMDDPGLQQTYGTMPDYECLLAVVTSRKVVVVFVKFVFLVLQTFQEFPAFIPVSHVPSRLLYLLRERFIASKEVDLFSQRLGSLTTVAYNYGRIVCRYSACLFLIGTSAVIHSFLPSFPVLGVAPLKLMPDCIYPL